MPGTRYKLKEILANQYKAKSNHMLQGKRITVSLFNIAIRTQTRPRDLSGSGCIRPAEIGFVVAENLQYLRSIKHRVGAF